MGLPFLALFSLAPQPGLLVDNEQDDVQPHFSDEEDYLFSDDADYQELKAEDVAGFIDKLGPVEHDERLTLMKASFAIPSEPRFNCNFHPLPECSRDRRHVRDRVWHRYYHMSKLVETDLPAMRYTQCNDPTVEQCFHEPTPILHIFNVKLQTCLADVTSPIEVYGIVAVRDGEDYCRNYLFNRSREDPLDISLTDGYLRLLSTRRGMSMKFNCLIEADIRVKAAGDDGSDDKTLADSCTEIVEDQVYYESLYRRTISGPYGSATFDFIVFRWGFEATIELDFLEVPEGGFDIQKMCGYTIVQKNYYAFIGENCECDSFVSSAGRFQRYFVAAVHKDDYLLVHFAEGKSPLIFKPNVHGSEEKDYSFHNGASVCVKVSWSTTFNY